MIHVQVRHETPNTKQIVAAVRNCSMLSFSGNIFNVNLEFLMIDTCSQIFNLNFFPFNLYVFYKL